jgi:hypothetical protein
MYTDEGVWALKGLWYCTRSAQEKYKQITSARTMDDFVIPVADMYQSKFREHVLARY